MLSEDPHIAVLKRPSGGRGTRNNEMTKLGRISTLALLACGAATTLSNASYAAQYYGVVHHNQAYNSGYGGLRDDDSDNAKNPAPPSYAQNKGHETGGPGRMQIPD